MEFSNLTLWVKYDINPILEKERNIGSFNPHHLTLLVDGSPENHKKRKCIEEIMLKETDFWADDENVLSRWDAYEVMLKRTSKLIELRNKYSWDFEDLYFARNLLPIDAVIGNHLTVFVPCIQNLASEEQKSKWLPTALSCQMLGTYAQTELGHGTYMKGFETLSIYDSKTEEFVLSSPTLTSMKWWPGGLGKSATHAIVMAQTYSMGQHHGLQTFLIQLRDLETHQPLPGITVGDIGRKSVLNSSDQGFLKLDKLRIPRENMLMGFAEITKIGTFKKVGNSRLQHGTLVVTRVVFLKHLFSLLSRLSTIVVRYSVVRHQSPIDPAKGEVQILDHKTQQYKVLPAVATTFAFLFGSRIMMRNYQTTRKELEAGNYENFDELHFLTAAMKAFSSDLALKLADSCRRACGGHGFLDGSAVPNMFIFFTMFVTGEGENTVMYLVSSRYLLQCCQKFLSGKPLPKNLSYLAEPLLENTSLNDLGNPHVLLKLYQLRARKVLFYVAELIQGEVSSGKNLFQTFNEYSIDLVRAARAHAHQFMALCYIQGIADQQIEPNLKKILLLNCQLFLVYGILENTGDFLEFNCLTMEHLSEMRRLLRELLTKLRPEAVITVDGFDIPDQVLNSTLGSSDGNVYRRMFEHAKKDPLNQQDIHPSAFKYLRKILHPTKAKL